MKYGIKTHRGCDIYLSIGKTFDTYQGALEYADMLEDEELSSEEIVIYCISE